MEKLPDGIELPSNPPGYGEVIGGVVLYDAPDEVVNAALAGFITGWRDDVVPDEIAAEARMRMRAALNAAIKASA